MLFFTQLPRQTKLLTIALIIIILATIHFLNGSPGLGRNAPDSESKNLPLQPSSSGIDSEDAQAEQSRLPCQSLQGGDDVLVVMRTGSTEIKDKLPVHFDTTFKCYKHLVIFSDYAETFHGHQVHDVLADVADDIKTTDEDFVHYQHVLRVGRENLDPAELSGNVSRESGPVGKNDNAGWRLDKWKFLPMLNATLDMYPDMNWYVFVEPDTYVVWSNLLQWLSGLNPAKPQYFGSEVMIGDDVFAHGGSAFVLSQEALRLGADSYRRHTRDLWEFTAGHWAGDAVLGIVLQDVGVDLTWSWPMFQGGNPSLMRWEEEKGEDRRLWCSPALSYHHLSPEEKLRLFDFEQDWLRAHQTGPIGSESSPAFWQQSSDPVLHHRDTYKQLIRPELVAEKSDWNNFPEGDWIQAEASECRDICEKRPTCLQYAYGPAGCATGSELRLGQPQPGVTSGWLTDRVDTWIASIDHCPGHASWTVS